MADDNMKNLIRQCPICSCKTGEILHEQKFETINNCALPSSYHVVSCSDCGFVFADTSATQHDYDIYYGNFSKYEDTTTATGGYFRAEDVSRFKKTAHDLSPFLKKTYRIADLGCANGGMLLTLERMGFHNLLGIDPSKKCVQNVCAMGIEAVEGGLFSDNFNDRQHLNVKFDCIILSHVLEHIHDLKTAINNCVNLLNNNGLLYVEVPDASRYSKYYIVPYYYFDCEHINHFSKESFNNLLAQYGFDLIYSVEKELIVSEDKKYPAIGLVYHKTKSRTADFVPCKEAKVKYEVLSHVDQSRKDLSINAIDQLYLSHEKIYVWGAGSYTLRLLANTNLKKCNIVGFVDNDSNKYGAKLLDICISSPNEIKNSSYKIIICSALHSSEIANQIRQMNLINDIIAL